MSLFWSFLEMTRKLQIKSQKWEEMRRVYLTGNVTLKELARLYDVGYSTIRRYASANNWFTHKRSRTVLAEAEARNRLSRQLIEQAAALQKTAPYCVPMPAAKHYDTLIRLMQLSMKLKRTEPQEERELSGRDNIIPLRQSSTSRVRRKIQ